MRKLQRAALAAFLLFAAAPAFAANLFTLAVTTAQSAQVSSVMQFVGGAPRNVALQATFTYGSGGTTADAWVQTSVDGGTTWTDIADFHFTTASARFLFNLSAATPVTTEYTPTDGSMTSNTAKDGLLGTLLRVKYTTVGTYAGGTTMRVDLAADRALAKQ